MEEAAAVDDLQLRMDVARVSLIVEILLLQDGVRIVLEVSFAGKLSICFSNLLLQEVFKN